MSHHDGFVQPAGVHLVRKHSGPRCAAFLLVLAAFTAAAPADAQTPPAANRWTISGDTFKIAPNLYFSTQKQNYHFSAQNVKWSPAPAAFTTRASVWSPAVAYQGFERTADPLANAFFPPELVMQHQQRIGLTGEQRAAIIRAIQEAQPRFIEAQWQLEPETAALADMVKGPRVDQQRLLQQIDRILEIERRIKRSQIELLVAIKNQLTEEQQAELARLGGARGLMPAPREP
ncbi:MAG TPA: hypothetical protein VMN60_12425 [Longimicrobiales bacterium]|nr:hypothetical protein [Longimicrobiales bacterium]